jgi:Emfourin
MRIEFTQTGGIGYFPGLNKPVTVEVDHLDKEEAEELKRLIEAARFFELPAAVGSPARGAADYQYYILTVEDGGRRHTVRVLVPVEDRVLDDLVRTIQKHVKAARAAGRGSRSNPTAGKPRR